MDRIEIIDRLEQIKVRGACCKKQVGCLVLYDGKLLIEAANGRPASDSCLDGHCMRCAASNSFTHGRSHDLCSCLHAEQNVIVGAARSGVSLAGTWLYTTYQPCMVCLKLIVGSGFEAVRYLEAWAIPEVDEIPNLYLDYRSLESELTQGSKPL